MLKTPDYCVIVEPRNHAALSTVVNNVAGHLPCELVLFHGAKNRSLAEEIRDQHPDRMRLEAMLVDNLTISDYNALFFNEDFWKRIGPDSSTALIYQVDSGICGTTRLQREALDEALRYEYCGAPWRHEYYLPEKGGNGGFSTRSVGASRRACAEASNLDRTSYEDVAFSRVLEGCPRSVGQNFSLETDAPGSGEPFGFHKTWNYQECPCAQCDVVKDLQHNLRRVKQRAWSRT